MGDAPIDEIPKDNQSARRIAIALTIQGNLVAGELGGPQIDHSRPLHTKL